MWRLLWRRPAPPDGAVELRPTLAVAGKDHGEVRSRYKTKEGMVWRFTRLIPLLGSDCQEQVNTELDPDPVRAVRSTST